MKEFFRGLNPFEKPVDLLQQGEQFLLDRALRSEYHGYTAARVRRMEGISCVLALVLVIGTLVLLAASLWVPGYMSELETLAGLCAVLTVPAIWAGALHGRRLSRMRAFVSWASRLQEEYKRHREVLADLDKPTDDADLLGLRQRNAQKAQELMAKTLQDRPDPFYLSALPDPELEARGKAEAEARWAELSRIAEEYDRRAQLEKASKVDLAVRLSGRLIEADKKKARDGEG